jgi:Family of unknown function (DUF5367)
MRDDDMRRQPRYVLYVLGGLAAFAAATLAIRLSPREWIEATDPLSLGVTGLLAVALVAAIVVLLRPLAPVHRAGAAAALAVPGMTADAAVTAMFPSAFPHLDPAIDGAFGASMLAGYALIIATGLVMARLSAKRG